VTAENLKWP